METENSKKLSSILSISKLILFNQLFKDKR